MKQQRKPRLPQMNWRPIEPTKHGCERWQTVDGLFQLVCADKYDGIKLPTLWQLFQFKAGEWRKVAEERGRTTIEKNARQRLAAIEASENDE